MTKQGKVSLNQPVHDSRGAQAGETKPCAPFSSFPPRGPPPRGALASEADAIALDLAGGDDDEARRAAIELLGLAQAQLDRQRL